MKEQRWLRIIPVALVMYTISYVDRTNVSLAFDPSLSTAMKDLGLDDTMKGNAIGVFFWGYLALQIPGGYLANHWSARKLVSVLLVAWGASAVGCGLARTPGEFKAMRFLLGVSESGVYPATLVLLASWFPRHERARANAWWILCQPLAVAVAAPVTTKFLQLWGWRSALIVEGALPFVWLPIWWYFVRDNPREAEWISAGERDYLEQTLARESAELGPKTAFSIAGVLRNPALVAMILIYFLQNCAGYGCNTFLSEALKGADKAWTGYLYAGPYIVAAICMIITSRHSDKTGERPRHVALVYAVSGVCLIGSVLAAPRSFWLSYAFLCFAIQGPFSGQSPFWTNCSETTPPALLGTTLGLVNALGNVGGWAGNYFFGWLKQSTGGTAIPFAVLGGCLLVAAALCLVLPSRRTGTGKT
jgi:MFS family permease